MPDEVLLLVEKFKSKKIDIPVVVSKNRLKAARACLNNDEIYYNLAEMEWNLDTSQAENNEIIPDETPESKTEAIDITYECAYKDVHDEFDGNKRIAILDDGFTALNIKKDINIIIIDASVDIFIQDVIPAGILREPLSALKYADIAVINKCRPELLENQSSFKAKIENKLKRYNKNCPVFYSYYKPNKLISQKNVISIEDLKSFKSKGGKILSVCAIGNSDYFYENLNDCGAPADYKMEFADHYEYAETDFKEITNILNSDDKYIAVTTLKDYVKLKRFKKFSEASRANLPVSHTSDAYIYELYNKAFDKIYYLDFDIIIDGNFYEHIYDIYKKI
ncbi:MAG: tetraacyldisaccharide 4'-kinase [Deltaproteobacteria bacterium]|nr:tetraacyldisaccharide 4'-kinase [Deltaproteobacteria bacterium]